MYYSYDLYNYVILMYVYLFIGKTITNTMIITNYQCNGIFIFMFQSCESGIPIPYLISLQNNYEKLLDEMR